MDQRYDESTGKYAERTYGQILRAVGDLRQDVAMVTGAINYEEIQQIFDDTAEKQAQRLKGAAQNQVPELVTDASKVIDENVIIVGTVENSAIIKDLIAKGKLKEASSIQGQSEAYVIKQVADPIEGNDAVKKVLVIAGSDARGTIYGIYDVSERIGVSPWYWWSDVPVDVVGENGTVLYPHGTTVESSPSIPYRGIFINDEEQLREWAYQNKEFGWPYQVGHPGVYRHVYELLLRLKANTLWPAMHEGTTAFNVVKGEDGTELINARNAAEYGIIMSSSHCEMMLRNNVGEWADWYNANKTKYNIQGSSSGNAWDYTINKNAILAYWEERIASNKDFESIFTVGLRGVHDGGPRISALDTFIANKGQDNALGSTITVNGTSDEAKRAALMKDVIYEQRQLIKKYFGSEDGAPQAFIPYKEMNTYYNYNNGDLASWLAQEAPDVTLVWSNDNFGYLRQTPNAMERANGRSNGVYYHNSYWGVPKSYLWLNSNSVALMNTELHRAYNTGARDYWILNVGDIKPGEISAEYFMDMAWDIESADDSKIEEALAAQVKRDFNLSDADATAVAACLDRYYQYSGTKRAEFYGKGYDFSVTGNGDEGMLWVNQWNTLVNQLETIYNQLDESAKDAFYEQILHAVKSSRDVAEEYIYYQKNQLAVEQGRYGSSRMYAQLGQEAIARIKENQDQFWSLNDGKWYGVINYQHRARYRTGNGTTWSSDYQGNQGLIMKADSDYKTAEAGEGVGAACENAAAAGSGTLTFSSLNGNKETHYFDVFGKEDKKAAWTAKAPEWVLLSAESGSVYTEKRIKVNIDWSKVTQSTQGEIQIYAGTEASGTPVATFTVKADCVNSQLNGQVKGYQESNGYVMIEAEHWSDNIAGTDGTKWQTIHSLGQRGSAVRVTTADNDKVNTVNGDASVYNEFVNGTLSDADKAKVGHVSYNVYFEKAGTYKFTAYRLPTLDEYSATCRTAVVVNGVSSSNTWIRGNAKTTGSWGNNILRGIEPLSYNITVNAGWNTIELYRMSPSQTFDRFLIVTDSNAAPVLSGIEIGAPVSPNNLTQDTDLQEFQTMRIGELPQDRTYAFDKDIELTIGNQYDAKTQIEEWPKDAVSVKVSNSDDTVAGYENGVITAKKKGQTEIKIEFTDTEGNMAVGLLHVSAKREVKPVEKILADFNFDTVPESGKGFDGGNATASGAYTLVDHGDGKALKLNGTDQFLTVTAKDGSSLLTDVQEMTVSFQINPESSTSNWAFFAAPNANQQSWKSEQYLGIFDKSGTIIAERYNSSSMDRPESPSYVAGENKWFYVTVVYAKGETILYVDGDEVERKTSTVSISDLLEDESILYIGKSTWGSGEYMTGLIDNYKMVSYVMTEEEIAAEAAKYDGKEKLREAIDATSSVGKEEDYTPDTWKVYAEALEAAKKVLEAENASQSEIDKAAQDLEDAQGTLVRKGIPEVLADFKFDADGEFFDGVNAKATGTYTLVDYGTGKALKLNGNNQFLTVTDKDGGSLLTGIKEMTVSYQIKPENSKTNWGFFAAPNADKQEYEKEHYLGIVDISGTTRAERYNGGVRPAVASTQTGYNGWYYVTVVYTEGATTLYINGEKAAEEASTYALADILGENSILYIGKSTWEQGEYATALIDNYKIVSKALTAEEVKAEAVKYVEKDALKAAIDTKVDAEDTYTAESWKVYADALTAANTVYNKKDASQAEVDAAAKTLTDAVKALKKKPVVAEVDKTALQEAIRNAVSSDQKDKYTEDSWKAYEDALAKAKEADADQDATQAEVDAAAKALADAQKALKEKPKRPFVDVDMETGNWYYDAVYYNFDRGIMNGVNSTHFEPLSNLARAQFAIILHNMEGKPAVSYEPKFKDVAEGEWYTDAILWASSKGIVTGYTDGSNNFGWGDNILREQMAVMMYRYAKEFKKYDVSDSADFDKFADAASVSEYAKEAMKWAVGAGIITGKDLDKDGTPESIDPLGDASRAECAIIIQRFLEKYN